MLLMTLLRLIGRLIDALEDEWYVRTKAYRGLREEVEAARRHR